MMLVESALPYPKETLLMITMMACSLILKWRSGFRQKEPNGPQRTVITGRILARKTPHG